MKQHESWQELIETSAIDALISGVRLDIWSVLGGIVERHSAILLEFSSMATRSCDRFLRIKSVVLTAVSSI